MERLKTVVGPALLTAMGGLFTVKAATMPTPLLQQDLNTTPAFFPVTVGSIFTGLALIQTTAGVLTLKKGELGRLTEEPQSPRRMQPALLLLLILLGYVLLMQVFGWFACSVLMLTAVISLAGAAMGRRPWSWMNLGMALGLSVLVFVIFDIILGVPLPRGRWSLELLVGM
jgi:lysylphosphatidylglycerol synthetase-like protein (DUF2156 family)